MLPLAKIYREKATVISGFRSAEAVILQEDFKKTGAETILCTDDGTTGRKGFVTEPLKELLEQGSVDAVYACGPMPMLKNIASLADAANVYCEVSLKKEWAAESVHVWYVHVKQKKTVRSILHMYAKTVLYSMQRR